VTNVGRIFANALVRRVAYVLVALLLAWAGIGKAHATKCGLPNLYAEMGVPPASGATLPDLGAAAARCGQLPSFMTRDPMGGGWYSTVHLIGCEKRADSNTIDAVFANGPWVTDGVCNQGSPDATRQKLATWFASAACPNGGTWDAAQGKCTSACESGAALGVTSSVNFQQVTCTSTSSGAECEALALVTPSQQPFAGYVQWFATGDSCDKDDYTCPTGYFKDTNGHCTKSPVCPEGVPLDPETGKCADQKECPAGTLRDFVSGACKPDPNNICKPGQIKGPDGLCIDDGEGGSCKAGTVKGSDGTCKPDENGDGEPDGEETNKAEDSARCDKPPVCSGDQIMCLHAKQLWRVDCNTRRNANVDLDAYCKRPPICEQVALGDDNRTAGCTRQEEASLFLQWKTMCAVQALGEKDGSSDATGDANKNGVADWWENVIGDGTGDPNTVDAYLPEDGNPGTGEGGSGVVREGQEFGLSGLDQTGLGLSRSCPNIPSVDIYGKVISFDLGPACDLFNAFGYVLLLMTALFCLRIIVPPGGV